jgi:hypothetical protein
MRCLAYQVPAEAFREVAPQVAEELGKADRDQLLYLLEDRDLEVELLSGEWRVLLAALTGFPMHREARCARLLVEPGRLAEFVRVLADPERQREWASIAFGLAELADALPRDCDLVGLVLIEEADDWLWDEPRNEIFAMRPEVYALLEPHMRDMVRKNDHPALARLADDHAEGVIVLNPYLWQVLRRQAEHRAPRLVRALEEGITGPDEYEEIHAALATVSDPSTQPSLDAWLRVHGVDSRYALYFREAAHQAE